MKRAVMDRSLPHTTSASVMPNIPSTELRSWRSASTIRSLLFVCLFALLSLYTLLDLSSIHRFNQRGLKAAIIARQASSAVLKVFQVHEPVLTLQGTDNQYGCVYTELLMEHSFGFSYGIPFVGKLAWLSHVICACI